MMMWSFLALCFEILQWAASLVAHMAWGLDSWLPAYSCAFMVVSIIVYLRARRVVHTDREEAAFKALRHPDFALAANFTAEHVCMYCLRAHEFTQNSPGEAATKEQKVVLNVPSMRCKYHRQAPPDLDLVMPLSALQVCSLHAHKSLFSAGGGKSTISPFDVKAGQSNKPLMVFANNRSVRMLTLFPVARVVAHLVHFAGHTVHDVDALGIRLFGQLAIQDVTPCPPWRTLLAFWQAWVLYNWYWCCKVHALFVTGRAYCAGRVVGGVPWRARRYVQWVARNRAVDRGGAVGPEYGDLELGERRVRTRGRRLATPLLGRGVDAHGLAQVQRAEAPPPRAPGAIMFDIGSDSSSSSGDDDAGPGAGGVPPRGGPSSSQSSFVVPPTAGGQTVRGPPPGLTLPIPPAGLRRVLSLSDALLPSHAGTAASASLPEPLGPPTTLGPETGASGSNAPGPVLEEPQELVDGLERVIDDAGPPPHGELGTMTWAAGGAAPPLVQEMDAEEEGVVEYYGANEPVLGSVYECIVADTERHGWSVAPLEPSYTIRRKLDSKSRVRAAVGAGEPLEEALDRQGVPAQARVVVPLDRKKTLYIADPSAPSNIDKAIYERHYPDTKPVRYYDRQLAAVKEVAGRLGGMLGGLAQTEAYHQCVEDMMPKKWSPAYRKRAFEALSNMDLAQDDQKAARAIRQFFVKSNESLAKAKPRGILAEPSPSVVLLHAMLSFTVEAAFKVTGLKWRTLKGATPQELNKRVAKLLGKDKSEWKAVSADFGKFDSSLRHQIRMATEVEFCRAFVRAAGLEDSVYEKLRDADRAKEQQNFRTLYSRITARLFGRASGDRFTATGNLLDNLILHVAFYKCCGYDWEGLLWQLLTEIDLDDAEAEMRREIELLLEGDDNAPMFKESALAKLGMANWDDFLRAYNDWFEALHMAWEPMRNDGEIAQTGDEAFRQATDRLEFVSRHFFVDGDFVGSFPKLTKALSTCRVSFSSATSVNVGASMFESARALSTSCPVLYEVQSALQRFHKDNFAGAIKHEGYLATQMEMMRKAVRARTLEDCIQNQREQAAMHDEAAREYVARNYVALTVEKQKELENRARGCSEWSDLGAVFNELDDLARVVPARA